MLCDICKERAAVIELTQIMENSNATLHLCEKCAAERGVETTVATPKHPLGEFLQAAYQQVPSAAADAIRCSFCSGTMKDFRATGRLGCSHCYTAFEASLRELLRRVHGQSKHIGRRYEPPHPDVLEKSYLLGELRERLRRAVESEQFELAADLRDRIRVME